MNREIKTDLHNILSHICVAQDYGYYDNVLMSDFAELTGYVTDSEINDYIEANKGDEYTDEDYEAWYSIISEWRNDYTKKSN